MDNASAYGAEDSRFESWQDRIFFSNRMLRPGGEAKNTKRIIVSCNQKLSSLTRSQASPHVFLLLKQSFAARFSLRLLASLRYFTWLRDHAFRRNCTSRGRQWHARLSAARGRILSSRILHRCVCRKCLIEFLPCY